MTEVIETPPVPAVIGARAFLLRRSTQLTYLIGALVLSLAAMLLPIGDARLWVMFAICIVYLGPLGLGTLLLLGIPVISLIGAGEGIFDIAVVVICVLVALVNTSFLRRWARGTHGGARLAGDILFLFAGDVFIALCYTAGYIAATSNGFDVQTPQPKAGHLLFAATVTWWPGLIIAAAGLVVWIVRARRGLRLVPIALVELIVLLALVATAIVLANFA